MSSVTKNGLSGAFDTDGEEVYILLAYNIFINI